MKSQTAAILDHLLTGRSLTPLEALELCGSLRCGGRILELRQQGHDIRTEMIPVGKGKRVARYSMPGVKRTIDHSLDREFCAAMGDELVVRSEA